MNNSKLAAMPYKKIDDACLLHANRALEYQEGGNTRMFSAHAKLLDQCADVLRAKLGKPPLKSGRSAEVIVAVGERRA